MPHQQYIAFLRGINVGGHTLKMADLRALLAALGLGDVSTYIASGNVVFTASGDPRGLEQQIEGHLERSLGYPVATFVRSPAQVAAIAARRPFQESDLGAPGSSLYVAFLHDPPGAEMRERVLALRSSTDDLHVDGREIYWLCRTRMSASPLFARGLLEKAVAAPMTTRNVTTVRKLAETYAAPR